MITSDIAISLHEALLFVSYDISTALYFVENDLDTADPNTIPYDFVASLLHNIYSSTNYQSVKASVLRIVCMLEIISKESIIKKYLFDKLIAQSIEQKQVEQSIKVDEEKAASFRCVSVLIKYYNILPQSIFRALYSLFYTPKHSYRPLVAAYLSEAAIVCHSLNKSILLGMSKIFIDSIFENFFPDGELIHLISFSIENHLPLIFNNLNRNSRDSDEMSIFNIIRKNNCINKCFISKILSPISQKKFDNKTQTDVAVNAVTKLLLTWPGAIYAGIELDFFSDLLHLMQTEPNIVLKILQNIIFLNINNFNSYHICNNDQNKCSNNINFTTCLNSHSGFILYILEKLSFSKKLNLIDTKTVMLDKCIQRFVDSIQISLSCNNSNSTIFINNHYKTLVTNSNSKENLKKNSDSSPESKMILNNEFDEKEFSYNISKIMTMDQIPNNIQQFSLSSDDSKWDWEMIEMFILIVLPHNDKESRSSNSENFINKVLNFLCTKYLSNSSVPRKAEEIVLPLVSFLISNDWGVNLLTNSSNMRRSFEKVIKDFSDNKEISASSPNWIFFKNICFLLSKEQGNIILTKWGLINQIVSLGEIVTNISNVKNIFQILCFSMNTTKFFGQIVCKFLLSNDKNVCITVTNEIRNLLFYSTDFLMFASICFENILLSNLKSLRKDRISIILHLICDFLLKDKKCIQIILNNPDGLTFIKENARFVFSFLFSNRNSFSKPDIETEVKWWIDEANLEYVKIFDKSIDFSINQSNNDGSNNNISNLSSNENGGNLFIPDYPFITFYREQDECKINALIPPHLFGQLAQTDEGEEILGKYIPELVQKFKTSEDINEIRSIFFAISHFASSPKSSKSIIKNNIIESMIEKTKESRSYVLKGSLLCCLSLFADIPQFNEIFLKSGFQIFWFSSHKTIVPIDYVSFSKFQQRSHRSHRREQSANGKIKFIENNTNNENIENKGIKKINDNSDEIEDNEDNENDDLEEFEEFEESNNNELERNNEIAIENNCIAKSNCNSEELLKWFGQLMNPIINQNAVANINEFFENKGDEFLTIQNVKEVHKLLSEHIFPSEARTYIYNKISSTSVVERKQEKMDLKKKAIVCEKIRIMISNPNKMYPDFNRVSIPSIPLNDIKKLRPFCPEVYMSDDQFLSFTSISKEDFYNLPENEVEVIRQKLLI